MMSSATSTKPVAGHDADSQQAGFRPWHFYVVAAMLASTAAVAMTRHTHPVALVLLSAAIIAAGVVGAAAHRAIAAFTSRGQIQGGAVGAHGRETLVREKQWVLHALKELEFDQRMGKVSEKDAHALAAPLRARAVALMRDIERASGGYREQIERDVRARLGPAATAVAAKTCAQCNTSNEPDARFCKQCGKGL
jgi:hypothetical protein